MPAFSKVMTAKEWGFGAVMVSVRLALVGSSSDPDLLEVCELISRVETTVRIKAACEKLKQ